MYFISQLKSHKWLDWLFGNMHTFGIAAQIHNTKKVTKKYFYQSHKFSTIKQSNGIFHHELFLILFKITNFAYCFSTMLLHSLSFVGIVN